ncbi:unnamed protein product [Ectocarpus fasciculatus]
MPLEQMDFPASYEALRPVVEHEYFDHRAVPQLEEYLEEQVKSGTYDFEANKALLKLYQFFPDLCQPEKVALVLAKALMNVPSTDFMALMYIVPPQLHRCEPVHSLKRGADSLETAKFVDFWQNCADGDMPALIESVPGFKKHIRVFIVHTLATTFQDSTRQNMEQCLDLDGAELAAFVEANADVVSALPDGSKYKFALNEFNQIQPKKFKESVEFDKILKTIDKLSSF